MLILALTSLFGAMALQRVPSIWRSLAVHQSAQPLEQFLLFGLPHLGVTGAPLQLVVVERYDCLTCRVSAEHLIGQRNRPNLQVTLLQADDGTASSVNAALASRCVWRLRPSRFWAVRQLLYRQQGPPEQDWFGPGQLAAVAQMARVPPARLQRCLHDPLVQRQQVSDTQRANRLHGDPLLPALYLNGHWLPFRMALQPDLLTASVQAALSSGRVRDATRRSRQPPQHRILAAAP
ncbi:DsbA family protein [Deinococcus sonorensis]|uniref:DsbA family protein n=1 Tax=Deinococcus sonorensis TaxID=309891 RepID=A0ABV8Y851_9DEIO